MRRFAVALAVAVALGLAVPPSVARAQIQFQGLDLSGQSNKKKKKKKKHERRRRRRRRRRERKAPPPQEQTGTSSGTGSAGGSGNNSGIQINLGGVKVNNNNKQMNVQGLDLSGKTSTGGGTNPQAMAAATKLFKQGNYQAAAVAFYKIYEDPSAAGNHEEAEYLVAKSLYKMKMYHSALHWFDQVLAQGESDKYFKVSLEWLFFISRKTVNESVVLEDIAAYAGQDFPAKYKDEFTYLLAKYYFTRGRALWVAGEQDQANTSFAKAGQLLGQVSGATKFYPKALFLEALVLYQSGRDNEALHKFKDVVHLLNPEHGRFKNPNLRDLAFMQLARLHYGHRQNRFAIFYYNEIRRDSDQWLESLFEASWAYFRLGDYEKALGNMVTLNSPFFADDYFPEALILKAVIYYENCRYPEAKMIVNQFEREYGPVLAKLDELSNENKTPDQYYDLLSQVQKRIKEGKHESDTLERILKAALTDKEFKAENDSIQEVDKEMDSIADKKEVFKFSGLAKELLVALKHERRQLIQKAGIMASAKLYQSQQDLKNLVGQGLRIRFETTTKEKDFLEKQLQAGGKLDVVQSYGYSVAVSDEELYWPYEGEYWRDELGTYQYTLTKGCKEHSAATASKE